MGYKMNHLVGRRDVDLTKLECNFNKSISIYIGLN